MSIFLRTLAAAGVVAMAGCIGLAHVKIEMPPLLVQGVLLDRAGQPIRDQHVFVALSNFYGEQQTFKALRTGTLDANEYGYKYQPIRTGQQGEFVSRLPGESRYIGFMPPLTNPSDETLKGFTIGIRTANGQVAAIVVRGSTTDIRVPDGPQFKLVSPRDDFPLRISASIERSDVIDVLQLVVRNQAIGGRL
jgi:hypothetical protein